MDHVGESFLLLISGPSGVGKSSVYHPVMRRDSRLRFSVSCTTRASRAGEVEGEDYHFLERPEFERQQAAGAFVENFTVHAQLYGTRKVDLDAMLEEGLVPVLDLDVQGGERILQSYGERVVSVFLFPPSWGELERRLRTRDTEDDAAVQLRMENARWEVGYARHYHYWIVNDDLERAIGDLEAVLRAERLRRHRWPEMPLSGPAEAS